MIKVRFPDHHSFPAVYHWLRENCQGKFYTGSDWTNWRIGENNRMVEFTDQADAVRFALVWS